MEDIVLPPGQLGLELEPASISCDDSKSITGTAIPLKPIGIGCKVREWKSDPYGLSSKLTPGAVIQSVDGISVTDLPFKDIIQILGSSASRSIQYLRIAPHPQKGEMPLSAMDKENRNSNMSNDHMVPKFMESKSLTGFVKRGVLKNHSTDGRVHLLNSRLRVQAEELQHLQDNMANLSSQLVSKEQEVKSLEEKVLSLKQEGRSSDGKFAFAMFKLRKRLTAETLAMSKEEKTDAGSNAADAFRSLISDRIVHSGKMHSVMTELCRCSEDATSTAVEEDDDISSLSRKLEVQRRLNKRLTAQMHAWVDAQIKLQRSLAEADVTEAESVPAAAQSGEPASNSIAVVAELHNDNMKYSSFTQHGIGGKSFAMLPSVSGTPSCGVNVSCSMASVSVATPIEEKMLQPAYSHIISSAYVKPDHLTAQSLLSSTSDGTKIVRKTPGSNVRFSINAKECPQSSSKDRRELASIVRGLCQYGTPVPGEKGREPSTDMASRTSETVDATPRESARSKPIVPLTAYRLGLYSDHSSNRVDRTPVEVSESCVSEMTSESISIHQLSVCDQESNMIPSTTRKPPVTTTSHSVVSSHHSVLSTAKKPSSFHHFPPPVVSESPSVVAMRSRADKLRGDHELIRSDLQKFRAVIQHVKSEVHDTLSYAI